MVLTFGGYKSDAVHPLQPYVRLRPWQDASTSLWMLKNCPNLLNLSVWSLPWQPLSPLSRCCRSRESVWSGKELPKRERGVTTPLHPDVTVLAHTKSVSIEPPGHLQGQVARFKSIKAPMGSEQTSPVPSASFLLEWGIIRWKQWKPE